MIFDGKFAKKSKIPGKLYNTIYYLLYFIINFDLLKSYDTLRGLFTVIILVLDQINQKFTNEN